MPNRRVELPGGSVVIREENRNWYVVETPGVDHWMSPMQLMDFIKAVEAMVNMNLYRRYFFEGATDK